MKNVILNATKEHKITAILRGIENDRVCHVIDALYDGGIRLLEVTFNQKSVTKYEDTAYAISYAREKYAGRMYVGAGTVMSLRDLEVAFQSGAEFILTPNVNLEVIKKAVELGISAIPGAMTPSEVAVSYEAGAELVKLFPAGNLGLSYCKAIMAPINHIPMIAVGGVDDKNVGDFLEAGFMGVGIGSSLTNKTMIENQDYEGIRSLARHYMEMALK